MIVYGNDIFAQPLIAASQAHYLPGVDTSMVRIDENTLETLGGALYTEYNGRTLQMHVAGLRANWLNRELLSRAFQYPFLHLNAQKVFGLVEVANKRALDFDLHLGFKEEARVRDVYPSGDMIILAMYREDCRFIRGYRDG